jgi:hypothetical protein
MSLVLKRRLAVGAAVVAVFGGSAGTALACHGAGADTAGTTTSFAVFHHGGIWHHGGWWWWSNVTGYLGLSPDVVKADLRSGQTLAQIANATPGKSAAGLVAALVAPVKAKLDAKVAAGDLSAADETTILSHVTAKVTAFVNGDWHWWWGWKHDRHH